jgi:hypothetical protein
MGQSGLILKLNVYEANWGEIERRLEVAARPMCPYRGVTSHCDSMGFEHELTATTLRPEVPGKTGKST